MNREFVFIAGFGRSGSTLIEDFLQRNYNAVGLGELFFIWERGGLRNEKCSCGESFLSCPFWTDILADAFGPLTDRDFSEFHRVFRTTLGQYPVSGSLDRANDLGSGKFAEISQALYGTLFKRLGANVLIDSSKYPLYGASLDAAGAGSPMPLHIFRDPRAVAASWQRTRLRPEATGEQQYMARSRSVLTSALRWYWFNHTALQLRERVETVGYSLAYEEFCASPDRIVADLGRTFGLTPRTVSADKVGHSVSGNPSRFTGGLGEIRLDEGWKTELSTVQKAAITVVCQAFYRRMLKA